MQIDKHICVDNFYKIKGIVDDGQKHWYYDADSARDAAKNDEIRSKGGIAPEILKIKEKFAPVYLETVQTVKNIAKQVAHVTKATLWDNSKHLGLSISLHKRYLHETHEFHTDVPKNVQPRQLTNDSSEQQTLENIYMFPLTFVMYLLPSDTHAPAGMATTSVAPDSQQDKTPDQDTVAYSCTFSNCSISIFPAHNWHAVAPNPYYERATIAYKVMLLTDDELTWETIYRCIQGDNVLNNLLQEMTPQQTTYLKTVDSAHTLAADQSENPYDAMET